MIKPKMSNEELEKFKYPNLIAEFLESGYSICTLGDHMGMGSRRKENDPEILGKLAGGISITVKESMGLSRLFNCKLDYLFSSKLSVTCDAPVAYWRHYDSNVEKEKWHKEYKERAEIEQILREKPYLFEFMKAAKEWTPEQVKIAIKLLENM